MASYSIAVSPQLFALFGKHLEYQSDNEQMENGSNVLLMTSCIFVQLIMMSRLTSVHFGMIALAQMLKKSTAESGKQAREHCTLHSVLTRMRLGCLYLKKHLPKLMVIIRLLKVVLSVKLSRI